MADREFDFVAIDHGHAVLFGCDGAIKFGGNSLEVLLDENVRLAVVGSFYDELGLK